MLKFEHSSLINAPVAVVWHFHERDDILQILTPPWQPIQIIRRQGKLEVGAESEFRLWLGFIPIKWVARHIECQPYSLFTDEQVEGILRSWVHRHQFTSQNGQTLLSDVINYQLPGGWLSELLLGWWVNSRLEAMFRYRHQVTKRECEKTT